MALGSHIDFTSLEARTAAMRQLAMIEERIKNLTAASIKARRSGKMHEALAAQSEISDLGIRQRYIETGLSCVHPLAGFGAFGVTIAPSAQSVLNRETKEAAALSARRDDLLEKRAKLSKDILSLKSQLSRAGALELGKKSHLKSEIEEAEKAHKRVDNELKELDKKIKGQIGDLKEAQVLATNPAGMAAQLEVKIASLAGMEKSRNATISALDNSIKDLKKDLDRAGAMDFAKKSYIKGQIEKKESAKAAEVKELGKIRSQLKDLLADLGRAKTYAQVASTKATTVVTPTKVVTATGLVKTLNTKDRLRVDSLATKIADLDKQADELYKRVSDRLKDKNADAKLIIALMESQRGKRMEIRALKFELDTLKSGAAAARGLRLQEDKDRIVRVKARIEEVKKSPLPLQVRVPLLKDLNDHLAKCESLVKASGLSNLLHVRKGIALPIWRKVSPSQLAARKRTLTLKPSAAAPSVDMVKALSAAFAQAIPPLKDEKPEDYVARLKLYVSRGAVVAANNVADGAPKQEAVATAVKEVVVQDAPALEEEAKNKVQAPAGEEVVAQHVDAATPAIVEAATVAAPELMAQAAPADSSAAAADPNVQVVPTTVEAATAEAQEENKEVIAPADGEDTRPWYMKPSGMALIGVAALIGYKALASKE